MRHLRFSGNGIRENKGIQLTPGISVEMESPKTILNRYRSKSSRHSLQNGYRHSSTTYQNIVYHFTIQPSMFQKAIRTATLRPRTSLTAWNVSWLFLHHFQTRIASDRGCLYLISKLFAMLSAPISELPALTHHIRGYFQTIRQSICSVLILAALVSAKPRRAQLCSILFSEHVRDFLDFLIYSWCLYYGSVVTLDKYFYLYNELPCSRLAPVSRFVIGWPVCPIWTVIYVAFIFLIPTIIFFIPKGKVPVLNMSWIKKNGTQRPVALAFSVHIMSFTFSHSRIKWFPLQRTQRIQNCCFLPS